MEATAVGSNDHCARRLQDYLDAGADELVLHGTTPDHLSPVVGAFHQLAGLDTRKAPTSSDADQPRASGGRPSRVDHRP